LFVGKDQEDSITELVFVQHAVEFIAGFTDTVAIVGINDKDQALCVLEVMPPQWTNLYLGGKGEKEGQYLWWLVSIISE
jgi:hypothetical protein